MTAAAAQYLAARENAISFTHLTPRSWLADVRPVMTPTGWRRLAASVGDSGGNPVATARTHRWSVRTAVTCRHDADTGATSSTRTTISCAVTDITTNLAGDPVPAADLPAVWAYTGPQPPALLTMRRLGRRWLVDVDETGRAG